MGPISPERIQLVQFMREQLHKAYQLGIEIQPGHESEARAWDCSEATESAYRLINLVLPDGSPYQYQFCIPVLEPKPGDLGFLWNDKWGRIGHVFMLTESGTVIHAVGGRGVVEDPASMWTANPRFRGWRRHPGLS